MYVDDVVDANGTVELPLNQLYVTFAACEWDDDAVNTILVPSQILFEFTDNNGLGKSS